MAQAIGDYPRYPVHSHVKDGVSWSAVIVIGAAGAVAAVAGAPGIGAANGAAGVYSVTYPAVPADATTHAQPRAQIGNSAVPTVFTALITAYDVEAGTATVKTFNAAGAATNPASGDSIIFELRTSTSVGV